MSVRQALPGPPMFHFCDKEQNSQIPQKLVRISALNLTLPVRRKCLGETSGPKPARRGGSIRPCRPNGALFSHHSTNPCPRWKGGSHPPNTHECLQTCRNFLSLIKRPQSPP